MFFPVFSSGYPNMIKSSPNLGIIPNSFLTNPIPKLEPPIVIKIGFFFNFSYRHRFISDSW